MLEPATVITTISAGLKLIEQFRETALRVMGRQNSEPSVTVETKRETGSPEKSGKSDQTQLEIRRDGVIAEVVHPSDLQMGSWDQQRYETVKVVIDLLFTQFNGLEKELPLATGIERIRLQQQMERIKMDLCPKFREMLTLYQKTLGVPLEDHFALQSVCTSC